MTFVARVIVTLKPTVNDPQGLTIRDSLHTLGYPEIASTRAGKYLELRLDAPSRAEAEARVTDMCRRLLANPVIEDFHVDIEQG